MNDTMKRISMPAPGFLCLSVAGLCLSTLSLEAQNKQPKRPNILVILGDDIGYSDMGCMGSEINTPNIDRLAKNGVKFTQFYNTARCSPSRASLLTGLYPHEANMGHLASGNNYTEPGYGNDLSKNAVKIGRAHV